MNYDFMYFPNFIACQDGISPSISLPRDYKELVKEFEQLNRMQIIEDFAREVGEFASKQTLVKGISESLIRLKWTGGLLRHIGIGTHGGLDLEEGKGKAIYLTHNLGRLNGLYGAMIAINYASELIKTRR